MVLIAYKIDLSPRFFKCSKWLGRGKLLRYIPGITSEKLPGRPVVGEGGSLSMLSKRLSIISEKVLGHSTSQESYTMVNSGSSQRYLLSPGPGLGTFDISQVLVRSWQMEGIDQDSTQ